MRTVLYVEDNDLVREITAELLAEDGRQVSSHAIAEDALAAFKATTFDIVITDVSLPSMSGIDLVKAIVAIKFDTVIIVASGYALDLKFDELGPNVRCVTKPFDPFEILALAEKLLQPSSPSDR